MEAASSKDGQTVRYVAICRKQLDPTSQTIQIETHETP
jgi:hypothetical protein